MLKMETSFTGKRATWDPSKITLDGASDLNPNPIPMRCEQIRRHRQLDCPLLLSHLDAFSLSHVHSYDK